MHIRHIRHATHELSYNGTVILVDPVFSAKGTLYAIPGAPNTALNPLTDLPVPVEELLNPNLILTTHLHTDHFDAAASEALPKHIPVLCQPQDEATIKERAFASVHPVAEALTLNGIQFSRVGGTHGTGASAELLNPVSGYVLKAAGEPTVYLPGDTVWCAEVETALRSHRPDHIVCFGGEALYQGDSITMGLADFEAILATCPDARVTVLHTEGWNHCGLTRNAIRHWATENEVSERIWIPLEGEGRSF